MDGPHARQAVDAPSEPGDVLHVPGIVLDGMPGHNEARVRRQLTRDARGGIREPLVRMERAPERGGIEDRGARRVRIIPLSTQHLEDPRPIALTKRLVRGASQILHARQAERQDLLARIAECLLERGKRPGKAGDDAVVAPMHGEGARRAGRAAILGIQRLETELLDGARRMPHLDAQGAMGRMGGNGDGGNVAVDEADARRRRIPELGHHGAQIEASTRWQARPHELDIGTGLLQIIFEEHEIKGAGGLPREKGDAGSLREHGEDAIQRFNEQRDEHHVIDLSPRSSRSPSRQKQTLIRYYKRITHP